MWLVFGSAKNEVLQNFTPGQPTERPNCGGLLGIGSTIWAHWNAMKLAWIDAPGEQEFFAGRVNTYPLDDRGLVGVSPSSFRHLGHSKHYVTPAIYTAGLAYWHLSRRNPAFLAQMDREGESTLLERMRKAMRYQLDDLDGKSGVLTINEVRRSMGLPEVVWGDIRTSDGVSEELINESPTPPESPLEGGPTQPETGGAER